MKNILIFVVLAILLAGCTNNNKVNALTIEEAQEIALNQVTGKKVLKAKEDKDDGIDIYEFIIITDSEKYEIEIDANTGKVLKVEKDDDYVAEVDNTQTITEIPVTDNNDQTTNNDQNSNTTTDNVQAIQPQTIITAAKAQEIAMNRVGGGYLTKCELDDDDGTTIYEIEIKNGHMEYELDINAYTGEIVDYEEDLDD